MNMSVSYQSRIQSVFADYFQSSSDTPISRDEFVDAGWSEYAYLTYYRLVKVFYFAYMTYQHTIHSSLRYSSTSKEYLALCQNTRFVLDDSCEKIKVFFENAAGFTLSCKECLVFIESVFSPDDNSMFFSFQSFISVLESFIGKQLLAQRIHQNSSNIASNNIRKLFVNYYNAYSEDYFEIRPTIPKASFLSAGWSSNVYNQYYSITNNLYFSLMLRQNQWAPTDIWITNQNKASLKSKADSYFSHILNEFSAFIETHLHIKLKKTKRFNYIFGVFSGVYWCTPYDGRYDMETDPVKFLVLYASYNQFLSWLEYEIGDQILNSPPDSSDSPIEIKHSEPPIDAFWYKLPYSELYEYRIHTTQPNRESSRQKLLSFSDFNSENSDEKLQKLMFEFIESENIDEAVSNRLEEYEYGEFDVYGDILYIYKGETKCFQEHHHIESVTATVLARRGNKVDININCCDDCHKYFISESEFFHYRDLYGIVCGLKVDRQSSGYAKFPMAEYSILRLYGYNVGKEDNLSDDERQNLLKILVEHGYVKKPEIIKYLEMFIRMNQNRVEMAVSVCKWTADLSYIRDLSLENQPKVLLNKIKYAH